MGVGVDAEITTDLQRQVQQPGGRVTSFGTRVDLHGGAVLAAGGEDRFSVECRLRPDTAVAGDQPSRAVAEHVGMAVADGAHHPAGHRRRIHRQLRMHTGHHDVETIQQLGLLVQAAVVEDVHLDAGEDAHRREPVP